MTYSYRGREILVVAHRGGGNLFIENTLSAFQGVEKLGVDAVECDVQATKDGNLAVMHDPDLKRMAGIERNVKDLSVEELRGIQLKGGERIPFLEEVMDAIRIPVIIELKSMETINPLINLYDRRPDLLNRSIIISFYHDALFMFKQKYPNVTCGALIAGFPMDPVSMVRQCGCDTIAMYYEGLSGSYVDRCHEGGLKVSVWTPNDEAGISDSLDAGVDAIVSDRPDMVINLINSKGKI